MYQIIFSTQPSHAGFLFPEDVSDHKMADGCINAILSHPQSLDNLCGQGIFSDRRLVHLMMVNTQRLMYARGSHSVLKIRCPSKRMTVHTLVQDVLVFLVPPNCELQMSTPEGLIVQPAAVHSLTSDLVFMRPKLLFTYNLYYQLDTDSLQSILLYVLLGFMSTCTLATIGIAYYAFKHKVTAEVALSEMSLNTISGPTDHDNNEQNNPITPL